MIPIVETESILISSTGKIATYTSTGSKIALDVNLITSPIAANISNIPYVIITSSGLLHVNIDNNPNVNLRDGYGNQITSTLDGVRRELDVKASLTSTGNVIIIKDPNDSKKVTVKDETAEYPGVYSLDVNIRSGIVQVKLTGENLRYEELTKNLALTNGSYVTVYNNTSTGKVIWSRLVVTNNDVNIKVTVDDNIIINEFHLQELYKDYILDTSNPGVTGMDFIHTEIQGRVVVLNFPGGMEFNSYFKIELRANQANITMSRGLVVRSQE